MVTSEEMRNMSGKVIVYLSSQKHTLSVCHVPDVTGDMKILKDE